MTAEAESMDESAHSGERLALLGGVPAFSRLPEETLKELAVLLREERCAAGGVVVAEGDTGDRLYLISGGHAEVSAEGSKGPLPLVTLGPGEMFGEIALLEPGGKRQATVTATTDLLTLSLAAPAFHRVLATHPEARSAFSEAAEEMLVAKFLKQACAPSGSRPVVPGQSSFPAIQNPYDTKWFQESGASKPVRRSPATLPNSRWLRLTRVRSRERASAAIRRSFGPMGVPARSRSALMIPYSSAARSSKARLLRGSKKRWSVPRLCSTLSLFRAP